MIQEYKQLWRFYINRNGAATLAGKKIFLDDDESRLASQVLRLDVGEDVELADGLGWTARGVISVLQKKSVEVEVQSETHWDKPVFSRVAIVGLPKPGALDEVVQAAVDSGLEHLIFFRGERSTSRQEFKTEKIHRQVFELSRITKSPWNLAVHFSDGLAAALEKAGSLTQGSRLCFFVCDERPVHAHSTASNSHLLDLLLHSPSCSWACVVGPEASFSAREYELLDKQSENGNLNFVGLGQRILRTPAAVAAAAWLMAGCRESSGQRDGRPNSAQTPK